MQASERVRQEAAALQRQLEGTSSSTAAGSDYSRQDFVGQAPTSDIVDAMHNKGSKDTIAAVRGMYAVASAAIETCSVVDVLMFLIRASGYWQKLAETEVLS